MRDLILYGENALSVEAIADLLGRILRVRYTAQHDQLDVLVPDTTDVGGTTTCVVVYSLSREDLPPTMLEDDEREIILRTVGDVWNPIMVQYSDRVVAKQVVSLITAAFDVVVDTDHGNLMSGPEWSSKLAANPDWDLQAPLD